MIQFGADRDVEKEGRRADLAESAESERKMVFLHKRKLVFLSIIDEVSAEVMWIDKEKFSRVKVTLRGGAYDTLVKLITTLMAEARFSEEIHSDIPFFAEWNSAYVFAKSGLRWNGAHTLTSDNYKDDSVIIKLIGLGGMLCPLEDLGLKVSDLESEVESRLEFLIKPAEEWSAENP